MVLFCLKSKNKVRLEFSCIENAAKLLLEFYSTGHAKIKYGWDFKLLEMLNYCAIGVLYCSERKHKVRLAFSFIETSEVMYCSGFVLLKMLKYVVAGVLILLKS